MTQEIDLEKLKKDVFLFLDRKGFMYEQMADWKKFSDKSDASISMIVEKVNKLDNGYQVIIGPKNFSTGYDWLPSPLVSIHTYTNQNGIFIEADSMYVHMNEHNKYLIKEPKVEQIMLNYLSKDMRG